MYMKFALLISCIILSFAVAELTESKVGLEEPFQFTGKDDYLVGRFVNYINHVDQSDKRTYKQRFWYSTELFDTKKGPIFLYICGEYTCSVPYQREFAHQLARKHKGLYLVLEHRYYGESQPFKDWSTPNLKYLTIENALADTALFLNHINEEILKEFGGERRKVVVVGGSYPGAVSAWMRYKYPHIVDASISSSGVVNAILDYNMYDYQVYNSTARSGGWCPGIITNMTIAIDTFIKFNHTEEMTKLKRLFNAEKLNNLDFAMFFADQFAGKVQYGARSEMCNALKNATYANVWYMFNVTRQYFGPADVNSYSIESLKNTTVDWSKNMRQWTYQTCAEVGYYQTPHGNVRMRSHLVNLDYYKNICTQAFGEGIWPNVNHTNALLGETHLARTNIFFSNGVEDPWKWAGAMAVPEHSGMEAQIIDCPNCAHCVELYTPKDSDSHELKKARWRIERWLDNILRERRDSVIESEFLKLTE